MKKITIVTTTIFPDLWWWELYMFNLAKEFSKEYEVDVLCITYQEWISGTQKIDGINFHYLKHFYFGGHAFPAFFSVVKKLKEIKPDIIYTSWPGVHDFFAVFYNLFARKPMMMTYHAMHDQNNWKLKFFTKIYLTFVAPFYKSIIVTTQKYFDILQERKVKNLHLIPCGVEKEKLNLEIIDSKSQNKELLFVWVLDNAHRYKNLWILIDAMKKLPDFHLTVIGDGELRKWFEEQAKNLKNIDFVWAKRWAELKPFYEKANIFILPSNSSLEGFWIVLLEAIWNGCKIITGEKCGWSFLIRENSFLWKLYNGESDDLAVKIQKTYSEKTLQKSDVNDFLSKYYWENISKEIITTLPQKKCLIH